MPKKTDAQHVTDLDRMSPAARDADLGGVLRDLITGYNLLLATVTDLRTKLIAVEAKLDADGGVTDTNYVSTIVPAAITAAAVGTLSSRS